jgi:hypothetical protein
MSWCFIDECTASLLVVLLVLVLPERHLDHPPNEHASAYGQSGTRKASKGEGWRRGAPFAYDTGLMNEESLRRANAFLAQVAQRVQPGESLEATPADIGNQIGLPDPLAAARAVRALLARRRLEMVDGKYRLLDARPVDPGEPEAIPRPPRKKRSAATPAGRRSKGDPSRPTYSEVGRTAIDKLIELGREVGTLRGNMRTMREEAREAREAKTEAEKRLGGLSSRVRDLEAKLEMAESNLRTILAAARGGGQRGESVGDAEMDAILGVLRDHTAPSTPSTPSAPVEPASPST